MGGVRQLSWQSQRFQTVQYVGSVGPLSHVGCEAVSPRKESNVRYKRPQEALWVEKGMKQLLREGL